ncbi:secreted in xylem Six8 [Fusarium oxysporum]|nr:secreted in xylem Six8 [Fusarium oxysporum]
MQPLRILLLFPLAVSVAATPIDKRYYRFDVASNVNHSDTSGILLACITGAGSAFQAYAGCYLTAFRNDPRTLTLRMDKTRGERISNVLVILSGGALSHAVEEVVQIARRFLHNFR